MPQHVDEECLLLRLTCGPQTPTNRNKTAKSSKLPPIQVFAVRLGTRFGARRCQFCPLQQKCRQPQSLLSLVGHRRTPTENIGKLRWMQHWYVLNWCWLFPVNPAPKFAFRIGHCAFEVQDGHWEALYCTVCSINFVSDWYWLTCEFKLHLYSDVVSTCRKSGQIKMTMFEKKTQTWHPSHARSKAVGQDEMVCVCS